MFWTRVCRVEGSRHLRRLDSQVAYLAQPAWRAGRLHWCTSLFSAHASGLRADGGRPAPIAPKAEPAVRLCSPRSPRNKRTVGGAPDACRDVVTAHIVSRSPCARRTRRRVANRCPRISSHALDRRVTRPPRHVPDSRSHAGCGAVHLCTTRARRELGWRRDRSSGCRESKFSLVGRWKPRGSPSRHDPAHSRPQNTD